MIDDSDVDDAMFASMLTGGWWSLGFLVLAVALWVIASGNADECEQRTCNDGQSARLLDHECLCVEGAPP